MKQKTIWIDRLARKGHWLMLIIVALLLFWKLGQPDVQRWDEARRGINAIGMIEYKDPVNYYFLDDLDRWNAKPPLSIWMIALSFNLFGYNALALRLPGTLCVLLYFLVGYKLISLYRSRLFALIAMLILASTKAVIGFHVGRSGDTDPFFLLFLLLSVYAFLQYTDHHKNNGIFYFWIFTIIAFYAKGFTFLLFFPALLIYALGRRKICDLLKSLSFWTGFVLFLIFVFIWFYVMLNFGESWQDSPYGTTDRVSTMLRYDIFQRIFQGTPEGSYDPLYLFHVMDMSFNGWNYFFLAGSVLAIYLLIRNRGYLHDLFNKAKYRLSVLSLLIILTSFLFFVIMREKHRWYMAPVFLFIAVICTDYLWFLIRRKRGLLVIFSIMLLALLVRRFYEINRIDRDIQIEVEKLIGPSIKDQTLCIHESVPQEYVLEILFNLYPENYPRYGKECAGEDRITIFFDRTQKELILKK